MFFKKLALTMLIFDIKNFCRFWRNTSIYTYFLRQNEKYEVKYFPLYGNISIYSHFYKGTFDGVPTFLGYVLGVFLIFLVTHTLWSKPN